ncbi:MAG: DnaJ domain-containing protein [Deltaproteobacteria bacterium]|jgi:DnaJ-class molecular chaperone|nr:DnaJ domain-containing protein [Deltaproteobacteria bacterium]
MKVHWQSDFYAALGLDQGADQENLRKAYLQMALLYHPDRNPGDRQAEEKFKLISQAYAVLRDPTTRGRYDRMRRSKAAKPKSGRAARKFTDRAKGSQASEAAQAAFAAQAAAGASMARAAQRNKAKAEGTNSSSGTPFSANNRGHEKPTAKPKTARDDEYVDVMADLFKTREGRNSLDQVNDELKSAGLDSGLERVMSQLRQTFSSGRFELAKARAGNFLRGLKSKILSNPLSPKETLPPEDIVFGLVLTPEAAATGTTIDINYLRDNQPHRLSVTIPAGLAEKSRLRLAGQGHMKPAGNRGDLLLDLAIKGKQD